VGNLFVSPSTGSIGRIAYRVNLYDANVTGTAFDGSNRTLFAFSLLVHATQQAVVLQISPPGAARMVWKQDRAAPPTCTSDPFVAEASAAAPPKPCTPSADRTPGATYVFNPPAECTASHCQQKLLGGGDYAVAWGEHRLESGTFVLTVANSMAFNRHGSFVPKRESALAHATTTIQRVTETPLTPILAAHALWWHAYWPSHHVSIPDSVLEQYYIIQWYTLASATRCDNEDNCFAYDLNGAAPSLFERTPGPSPCTDSLCTDSLRSG
jgi:hypothetical protein